MDAWGRQPLPYTPRSKSFDPFAFMSGCRSHSFTFTFTSARLFCAFHCRSHLAHARHHLETTVIVLYHVIEARSRNPAAKSELAHRARCVARAKILHVSHISGKERMLSCAKYPQMMSLLYWEKPARERQPVRILRLVH